MLELLIAFVGGGALTAIIRGVFDLIKKNAESRAAFPQTIKRMNKIYSLMDELKSKIGCDRILIIKCRNGGGVPRPGKRINVSALYEVYDSNVSSIRDWWQNRPVDESYVKTLFALEDDESSHQIIIETDKLNKGMLKDTYIAVEIESSIITKLVEKDNSYYFMSCNFGDKSKINLAAAVLSKSYAAQIERLI